MSTHDTLMPDRTLLHAFYALKDILELTQWQVESLLGGSIVPPLEDSVRKRIHTILCIVALQDRGWDFASYPQVRPSFAEWVKIWFTTPQSELSHTSPLMFMIENQEDWSEQVLEYLKNFNMLWENISEASWTYKSLSNGDTLIYP